MKCYMAAFPLPPCETIEKYGKTDESYKNSTTRFD